MTTIVAYLRVSTKAQRQSGLGLDAQEAAVEDYCRRYGAKRIKTYTEAESGRKSDRPELLKAIGHARLAGATLVVAKLDRLSRNVAFLAHLIESGVDFACCDIPSANKLTLHVMAAIAEHEAEAISQRTKAALAAAKARGILLGSAREGHWRGREAARERGRRKAVAKAAAERSRAAAEAYAFLLPAIRDWRSSGASLADIAARLNTDGHLTRSAKPWSATAVCRLLNRDLGTGTASL